MVILIIFAVLIGLVIIANIFIWFAELIENTKLGSLYGDEVAALSARLESAGVQEMRMDFDSLRVRTCERIGRLIGPDAKVLNICPRCHGPVRARASYRGIALSCTYQGCYGSESVEPTDENVKDLAVR